MRKLIIILSLGLAACGNKAEVPERIEVVQSGKSTTEITVSFEFLNQLTALCRGLVANTPYPTPEARETAVSECVFNHLKDIGAPINVTQDFATQYCGANQTPDTAAACAALGF